MRYGGSRRLLLDFAEMTKRAVLLSPQEGSPARWPRGRFAFRDENIDNFSALVYVD
jgi:hypothetical protein